MRSSLLLAAAALLALGPATAQPVQPPQTVTLYSYGYAPQVISLAAGRPVTLTFVNRAGKGHDFTAKSFFGAARILSGRVIDGQLDLGGRQSARVSLVPAAGRYPVHCRRPFHKMLGMRATIVVR